MDMMMEHHYLNESDRQVELEDSIIAWQDKYDRLNESHKRIQKVNQNLEDKLLKLVDRHSSERSQLTSDVATLSVNLAQANYSIAKLQKEIERYKTDMALAIQLLHCKSDQFVPQKLSMFPKDVQVKVAAVRNRLLEANSDSDCSTAAGGDGMTRNNYLPMADRNRSNVLYRVLPGSDSPPPTLMCPFPPTAMTYSMRGLDAVTDDKDDFISPASIAKYLEEELARSESYNSGDVKHCNSCQCGDQFNGNLLSIDQKMYTVGTQTHLVGDAQNALCLRCNSNLNSPSRNGPYLMKHTNNVEGIKRSNEVAAKDVKKDELQVNPILGHRHLCDRVKSTTTMTDGQIKPASANALDQYNASNKSMENKNTFNVKSSATIPNSVSPHGDSNKVFENFNRSLINSIKLNEKSMNRPRICSLQLNPTGVNLLLENNAIESTAPVTISESANLAQIAYKRRAKLVDEELDDTNNVIILSTSASAATATVSVAAVTTNIPAPAPAETRNCVVKQPRRVEVDGSELLIELNKTDSEKVREAAVNMNGTSDGNQELLHLNDGGLSYNLELSDASETATNDSVNMLRQEQLDRIVEWVQQSNEQQNIKLSEGAASLNGATPPPPVIEVSPKRSLPDAICIDIDPDLVQMEYNVKQFLLKQNEWSSGCTGPILPTTISTESATPNIVRTETNL